MKSRSEHHRCKTVLPLALILFAFGIPLPLVSQEPTEPEDTPPSDQQTPRPAQTFTVQPATSEIRLDATLDEAAWQTAVSMPLPYEWTPGDNTPAPVDTECLVTYDDDNLYVACRAFDPEPRRIRAHVMDRDTPIQDDHIVFLLDTFNDQRRAYEFRVNPFGVQMDAILSQGSEDFSWDAIWDSSGRITEDGYVIEISIPFKSLGFQPATEVQTWGFIADRSYPRSIRHRTRTIWTDRDNSCLLCQADKLVGFQGVQPGRNVEITPTLTAVRTDEREAPVASPLETGKVDVEPGMFIKWGITPNVSMSGTVNPDFSQVEADVAQLAVNRRFALFFPEKRPFFLEGVDLFGLASGGGIYLPLVFTRTVVDPIAGGKFLGKLEKNGIGTFVTQDDVNRLLIPGSQFSRDTLVDQQVTGAVARYRRDVGQSSTLGALYTGRESSDYHNRVFTADGAFRLSRSNVLSFVASHSRTDYADGVAERFEQPTGEFTGEAFFARFQHVSRNLFAALEYRDLDPSYRGDAGFVPRVNVRGFHGGAFYTFWGSSDRWFSSIMLGAVGTRLDDYDERLVDQEARFSVNYAGPLQSVVFGEASFDRQGFLDEVFDLTRYRTRLQLRPSGDFTAKLFAQIGDEIDVANVREADMLRVAPEVNLQIGPRLQLDLSHTYERLHLQGQTIFVANLSQGRLVYHFNARAFVRGIVQYRDLDRNPDMYGFPVEENQQQVFLQFLFSYKVNPRTVLFAGYSDDRLGLTDVAITTLSRSFFLKLSYAWRP